jgi:hypothetical protein
MIFVIILDHHRPITDVESQLTDDDDSNGRDVPSTEQDLTEIDQQKKRRRTANYQHIISTTTTNGNHEDERISSPLSMSFDFLRFFNLLLINSCDERCWIIIKSSNNR